MSGFRTKAFAGTVWLTALMTLVADIPHLECCCPRDAVKPVSTTPVSSPSCCGCGGACCTSTEDSSPCQAPAVAAVNPGEEPAFVPPQEQQPPGDQAQLKRPQCVKAVVQVETSSPALSHPLIGADGAPGAGLPAPVATALVMPPPIPRPSFCPYQSPPQPADLVTLHQHFII
jgi:hypothetical protein